jgi:hypothetical protein
MYHGFVPKNNPFQCVSSPWPTRRHIPRGQPFWRQRRGLLARLATYVHPSDLCVRSQEPVSRTVYDAWMVATMRKKEEVQKCSKKRKWCAQGKVPCTTATPSPLSQWGFSSHPSPTRPSPSLQGSSRLHQVLWGGCKGRSWKTTASSGAEASHVLLPYHHRVG